MDEGTGLALEAGGGICWLEELESMAAADGGGGRPGVVLMGGGRRGSCFILEGLWKEKKEKKNTPVSDKFQDKVRLRFECSNRGGREGSVLAFSGRGCVIGPFLWAGTGAPCFNPGPAAGGLTLDDDAATCLVVRFGAAIELKRFRLKCLEILKKKQ